MLTTLSFLSVETSERGTVNHSAASQGNIPHYALPTTSEYLPQYVNRPQEKLHQAWNPANCTLHFWSHSVLRLTYQYMTLRLQSAFYQSTTNRPF